MDKEYRLLVINVGSTSTKVAYFEQTRQVIGETIQYSKEELSQYPDLHDQLPRREKDLFDFTDKHNINLAEIDMAISRGGLGNPGPAGAYEVNDVMCNDLLVGKYGKHPSALGPSIVMDIAHTYKTRALVIDPPSTDEFHPLARISGIPEIARKSAFHALNQKAAARRAAAEIGKKYENVNLVVAHLGGGITIGAHKEGRVIDCTHGLSEGPFTPERSGSLPTMDLIDLALSGTLSTKEIQSRFVGNGGLSAYLGTNNAQNVEEKINAGDEKAQLIYQAMAYQIAKDIGSMAAVLKGNIDGIVLTGGLAHSKLLTGWVSEWIRFLGPVLIYAGEDEMVALAEGAVRVLQGDEAVKKYE